MQLLLYLSFLLHFLAVSTSALEYIVKRVPKPQSLVSRAAPYHQVSVDQTLAETSFNLDSVHDLVYIANISVAGFDYPVQLDTGSSDLFIYDQGSPLPGVQDTSITHNLSYAIGWAFGHIAYAPVEFIGNYVPSQVFLDASNVKNPALSYGAVGIAGLGFSKLSSLMNRTNSSTGQSLLYNLFAANQSTPNFIAFALQRETQPGDDVQGTFSIGEVDSKYAQVIGSNRIPTWPIRNPYRWNILVDAIIVNGSIVVPNSRVTGAPSNKAVSLVDSGTSFSYASTEVCDAIYGSVPGASFDSKLGYWIVPCGTEINMAFQIAGEIFPMHPLDVNPVSTTDPSTCLGSFIPQQFSIGNDFDWIVGDNFLRSVYSMYDFGDYDSDGKIGDPYMKLLSLVDPDTASIEFHQLRGGTAKTNITFTGLAGASIAPSFSISNDITESLELIGKFVPAILGVVALNALVVIICCVVWLVSFCRRRRQRNSIMRTPRRRQSPVPTNPRNSYIAGVDPNTFNSHSYQPVSMALTDDTFVPPSPAFRRFDKKSKGDSLNGRPYSVTNTQVYEPVSPDGSFSPNRSTNYEMSPAENGATGQVGDRTLASPIADMHDLKNERISLRDERLSVKNGRNSVRDERLSAKDEMVSLRDERGGLGTSPRPSMDPLAQPTEDNFVRSSMYSHTYERSLTPAKAVVRVSSTANIQDPMTVRGSTQFAAPPVYPPSTPSSGNSSPLPQPFYSASGHMAVNSDLYVHNALPPPNPSYLLRSHRSSQPFEANRDVDIGDRPMSIA